MSRAGRDSFSRCAIAGVETKLQVGQTASGTTCGILAVRSVGVYAIQLLIYGRVAVARIAMHAAILRFNGSRYCVQQYSDTLIFSHMVTS